jgi:hypothetical protein
MVAEMVDMVEGAWSNQANLKQLAEQVAGVMDVIISRHTTIVTVETSDGQREQRLKAVEGGRYVGLTSHLKDLLEVRSQMRWWCIREKINQSPILMLTSWLMMMDPTHNNQPPSCNTLCLSSPGDHPVLQAVPGQGFRHQHLAQPW